MSYFVRDVDYLRKQMPQAYLALVLKSQGYKRRQIAKMMSVAPTSVSGLLRYARKAYEASDDLDLMKKAGIIK